MNPSNFVITDKIEEFLNWKLVFTIGHDDKFRPLIYLYPGRILEKELDIYA